MSRKIIDLGWCVAILEPKSQLMRIVSPSDCNAETYITTPAQDITIYGMENITRLRDGLNEMLTQG